MAQEYKYFLAEQVLNDGKPVTYRHVARAVGVHSAEAKRMLFEFHRQENEKRAGSVHATYILSGFQKPRTAVGSISQATETSGGHVEMQSSPYPASSMPQGDEEEDEPPIKTLTLAREEQLEDAKQKYVKLTGIHVYSIQSGGLKNLEILSSENERLFQDYGSEDLLTKGNTYGIIRNPNAKRRTGARPPPPTEISATSNTKGTAKAANPFAKSASKTDTTEGSDAKSARPGSASNAATSKPPTIKKESSNIFKSFAKSKTAKAKNADDEDVEVKPGGPVTDSSAHGAHSMAISSLGGEMKVEQDVHMADDDDDEGDDDVVLPKSRSAKAGASNPSKAEKDAELRRKMFEDDEDEEMPDAAAEESPDVKEEDAASPEEEDDEPKAEEPDHEEELEPVKEEEPKEHVTVSNGRRRGKRHVVRKKMIKDAEGYLVSREESGWESFSEEDVQPSRPKPVSAVSSSSGKKGAPAKKGQGNIMSFFGKK